MDFDAPKNVAMTPEQITKKLNQDIRLFGLFAEEWTWIFTQIGAFTITQIFFTTLLTAIDFRSIASEIQFWAFISTPLIFYILVKALRRITNVYGEGTAFIILSQHSLMEILFSNTGKNHKFNPQPSNNYKSIE